MPPSEDQRDKSAAGDTNASTQHYDEAAMARARAALYEAPEQVGPYRILERLGGGGMGEVYRAEQRSPIRRDVALKLIKLGMDTKLVIARFEAERQALAMMDHPHIAKVFDAGTEDTGRPYFIMEYVKGRPITDYADQNHLSIEERLELFEQVCHAVQHAHHKGIIHRDLKPSNVLVSTQDGKPFAKVIDFGIAKATAQRLTDLTLYTQHEQLLGTPQYMSPEQAEGSLDIDTRTDVYSLGVLLYELLTGSTPFGMGDLKAAALEQLKRMICEVDPPKPSTRISMSVQTLSTLAASRRTEPKKLGTLVQGELDWIVMKSLEKDRARRYDTPTSFAEDVKRYLTGQPVVAAPPSWRYRARKFVRRYKGPVFAVSAIAAVLLLGIAGTVWQAGVAIRERNNAQAASAREAARADGEAKARESAEFESYIANISAAQSAIASNGYAEARERLVACAELRRGWEWMLLWKDVEGIRVALPESTLQPTVSHDGQTILTASRDNSAQLWDLRTGAAVGSAMKHEASVDSALFSPDDQHLLTVSNYTARMWDVRTGTVVGEFKPIRINTGSTWHHPVFSPDGRRVLWLSNGVARLWDTHTGDTVGKPMRDAPRVNSACFNLDGTRILTSYRSNVSGDHAKDLSRLWETTTGMSVGEPLDGGLEARSTNFSSDGEFLVTASEEGVVRIVNARTGVPVGEPIKVGGEIKSAFFSLDGEKLLTVANYTARLWNAHTGMPVTELLEGKVDSAVFSPDGKYVLTDWDSGTGVTAQLWSSATGKMVGGPMTSFYGGSHFSPDSRLICTSCYDNTVRLWDLTTREVGRMRGNGASQVCCIQFFPSAVLLSTDYLNERRSGYGPTVIVDLNGFDSSAGIFDDGEHELEAEIAISAAAKQSEIQYAAEITDNGNLLVSSHGKTDRVFQRQTSKFVAATFTPNQERLVTASDDGSIRFWDTSNWREVIVIHTQPPKRLRFTPDGNRLVINFVDDAMEIWDIRSGEERQKDRDARFAAQKSANEYVTQLLASDATDESLAEAIRRDAGLSPLRKLVALEQLAVELHRIEAIAEREFDAIEKKPITDAEMKIEAEKASNARVRSRLSKRVAARGKSREVWDEAISSTEPQESYRAIRERATDAIQRGSGSDHFDNILGYAEYRLGDYEAAIATLNRPEAIDPEDLGLAPGVRRHMADWAFLAMAHFRLGHKSESQEFLGKFQETYAAADDGRKERYKELAAEVVALLNPPADKPATSELAPTTGEVKIEDKPPLEAKKK